MSHDAWLRQAESDLSASDALSRGGFHSQAVWLAAQAVEKGHKAILAALGLRFEERHYRQFGHGIVALASVLPDALHEPRDPANAARIATLESRAGTSRYPMPGQQLPQPGPPGGPGPPAERRPPIVVAPADSMNGSSEDVANARHLLDWCKERVGRAQRAVSVMQQG